LRLAILPRYPLLCYSLKCLEWVFSEVRAQWEWVGRPSWLWAGMR
jgi:hypothetical protein